jgi:hypothetical protein
MADHASNGAPLALALDQAALKPLITAIVRATVAELEAVRARFDDRLCYSEAEAARLLSLNVWQLRDLRLRGEITPSRVVGKRLRYLRDDLIRYLLERK